MISPGAPTVTAGRHLLAAALILLPASAAGAATGRGSESAPRIVVTSAPGEQQTLEAGDLSFVFFKRLYFHTLAPRSVDASGRRIDAEDRAEECPCIRFADWSKVKFSQLRQIEISYPEGGREALLLLTGRHGDVRRIPAGSLYGASTSLPPRFKATLAGARREFALLLGEEPDKRWPEERLIRILFTPAPRH